MRRALGILAGGLMLVAPTGALAAAEPESVSIYDLKRECAERHAPIAPEECFINDGPPVRLVRRFREQVIIVTPETPPTTERHPPAPATSPTIIQINPATPPALIQFNQQR